MPQEIGKTISNLKDIRKKQNGDLTIYCGKWKDCEEILMSVAWSGWGKVSSARAATRLLSTTYKKSKVDLLIFTGVAGSASNQNEQWDLIIPDKVVQYDMDASPLFERMVIPSLNKAELIPQKSIYDFIYSVFVDKKKDKSFKPFREIKKGLIATGDNFISDKTKLEQVKSIIPEVIAVEMEGAAVAQVAIQEKTPWIILRVISDNADNSAPQNFNDFLKDYELQSCKLIEAIVDRFIYIQKINLF